MLVVALTACGLGVWAGPSGVSVGVTSGARAAVPATSDRPRPSFDLGGLPFADAESEPSISAAEDALGWTFVLPDSCYGNGSIVSAVFVSESSGQVYVEYSEMTSSSDCDPVAEHSGHLALFESQPDEVLSSSTSPTLTEEMEGQAQELGPVATTQTVDGVPGVVVQGDYAGDCNSSPAAGEVGCVPAQANSPSVTFQFGGKDVQLIGDPAWPVSVMEAVADTVS